VTNARPDVPVHSWLRLTVAASVMVAVFIVAWFLGGLPRDLLGNGLHTAGGKLGWWIGDPNSNDGEESWGTVAGLLGVGVVGAAAVLVSGVVLAVERRAWPVLPVAAAAYATFTAVDIVVGLIDDVQWFGTA
jgi:hypothetical protein